MLAAGRPVLEVLLDVGVFGRPIRAEALPDVKAEDDGEHRRDRQQQGEDANPALAIQLGGQAVLADVDPFMSISLR